MRFPFPLLPAESEMPDEWWNEAGMSSFTPPGPYRATAATHMIPLREIEPPFRLSEWQRDFHGFCRARMVRILTGFVADADIEPILLFSLPQLGSYLLPPFAIAFETGSTASMRRLLRALSLCWPF